jgi:hypothetical protein
MQEEVMDRQPETNTETMSALTAGLPTKSAKIRTLGRAGYSRQQIADFLGIRYQHARNVLVDAKRAADGKRLDPEHPKTAKSPQNAVRLQVGPNGEVTIPAHLLEAAGSAAGKYLLARFDDDEIKLVTPEATARKIQAAVRKFVPEGVSLVDELLKERRREAANEQGGA